MTDSLSAVSLSGSWRAEEDRKERRRKLGLPEDDAQFACSFNESCCAEEDRRERRRKLGLPEELSEAEKEAEGARLAESAKAKPTIGLPVKPISLLAQMREVLVRSTFRSVS